jgi:aminoglycoside phosphotransferase
MRHPEKWRDTADPFGLDFHGFTLQEVLGYPHAGNDVFQVTGVYKNQQVEAFIKVARQRGADIRREIDIISRIGWDLLPEILDHDDEKQRFVVTRAKEGERLSTILGENALLASMEYMYPYGRMLARLHSLSGDFPAVKDRPHFHIPSAELVERSDLGFVREFLLKNRPGTVNACFCHGDFHYANILWKGKEISAILDFELAGMGNREFDIAWALIHRPGQKFLRTKGEIQRFLEGYCDGCTCDLSYVRYYMAQIYLYFYEIGVNSPGYQAYVLEALRELCAA